MHNALGIVDDPLFFQHRASGPHPERPERLQAARTALAAADISLPRETLPARDATDTELSRVHQPAYLEVLERAQGKTGHFDADTYYAPESVAAARRAAGGALALIDALRAGAIRYGLALLRPPGHHARPGSAMGFCLLNNVAIAAAHARASGAARVAIVDWDVHHGNGTQEMFYGDPSVLFISLHQSPFYPGTGSATETGRGSGAGYTVNIPLSAGADDAVYDAAFERLVAPIIEQYDPDVLLVSAGFDAHQRDPLASMLVSDQGYALMLERLVSALPRGASGRLGLVLEGGYDLQGLQGALQKSLESLEAAPREAAPVSERPSISETHDRELRRVAAAHSGFWRLG